LRKYIIIALALCVAGSVAAQEPTTQSNNVGFAAFRSYEQGKYAVSYGISTKISGNIGVINYVDIGKYGRINADLAAFFNVGTSPVWFGLVAGPGVDYASIDPTGSPVAYLTGSSGLIVGYNGFLKGLAGFEKMGLFAGVKYAFALEGDNLFQNGYNWGVGITYPF